MMLYDGHDYTELFDVLGVEIDPGCGLDGDVTPFKEALEGIDLADDADKIKHIREYVLAMSGADPGYWKPIWLGLANCEDDFTFMQVCYALAEHMWT